VSGRWVASTPQQAISGRFFHPLDETEAGSIINANSYSTWTGANDATLSCSDWNSARSNDGARSHFTSEWGEIYNPGSSSCSDSLRIQCFERNHNAPRVAPTLDKPVLFVSRASWTPNPGGRTDADALCQAEATQAGRIGTFIALLPEQSATAVSRLPNPLTTQYQRMDGELLGTIGAISTFIMLDALGNPSTGIVWTGGDPKQLATATCSSWTDPNASGITGSAGYAGLLAFADSVARPCIHAFRLYCAQL
jgi:hypothetical protein